ncbi:MAG TPA: hypothetical protein VFU80_00335 [Sphingomicrobium sp.]|nr:hypothetical protein [Sphingomicrobium sp.]
MSVRSFHSVFMASAVAGAALGCYLISLRVASERAALEEVESRIVLAQRDIRLLQTEIGTRARLAQLERWNVRVLSLSAPTADQILGDKFQLARLIAPQRKPALEAPVILATAPAPAPQQPLEALPQADGAPAPVGEFLHEASVKMPPREIRAPRLASAVPARIQSIGTEPKRTDHKAGETKAAGDAKKAGDKIPESTTPAVTAPVRTAKVDPLAPISADQSTVKAPRTHR